MSETGTAAVTSSSGSATPGRPRPWTVRTAVVVIWVQVAVGVASSIVFLTDRSTGSDDTVATLLVGQVVSVGLPAALSWPVWRARRWARWALVALSGLGVVLRAIGLGDDPLIPLGLFQYLSIVCNLGIVVLLLHPASRHFATFAAE